MKTGKVAQLLGGLDPQTVNNWVSRPEFESYFSPRARKVGVAQRDFDERDRVVLNTIRELRQADPHISWEEIASRLASGYRCRQWPTSAAVVEGAVPLEMMTTSALAIAERDRALAQLKDLQDQIDELKQALLEAERAYNDRKMGDYRKWSMEQVESQRQLYEEIGRLKYMLKRAGIDPDDAS